MFPTCPGGMPRLVGWVRLEWGHFPASPQHPCLAPHPCPAPRGVVGSVCILPGLGLCRAAPALRAVPEMGHAWLGCAGCPGAWCWCCSDGSRDEPCAICAASGQRHAPQISACCSVSLDVYKPSLLADLARSALFLYLFLSVGTFLSLAPRRPWLPAGWRLPSPADWQKPGYRARHAGQQGIEKELARCGKGKQKILPRLLLPGDTVIMPHSSEVDLGEKPGVKPFRAAGRQPSVTHCCLRRTCAVRGRKFGIYLRAMPSGQGCGSSEGAKVLFSAFSRGREGSSAEAITCPTAGTLLQRAKQPRSFLWSELKPALQLFPGKGCSSSTLQPSAPGRSEPIAVLLPAPAHPHLQSIPPSESRVPLPCQAGVTGPGAGEGDRATAAPGSARGSCVLHAAAVAA